LTILKPWKAGSWIIGFKVSHFQPATVLPASCLGPMSASSKHLNNLAKGITDSIFVAGIAMQPKELVKPYTGEEVKCHMGAMEGSFLWPQVYLNLLANSSLIFFTFETRFM